MSTIVHCATAPTGDAAATEHLVAAARRAGTPHLVFVSIVGVDRIPLGYYREKVRAERVVESSGLPWTILRATQFHDFLVQMFTSAARTGLLPVLAGTSFQPVAVDDVADRLADLVDGPAQGRASDLGGPEIRPMADLARAWLAASGRRRAVVPLRLPGAIARGYRDGAHLTPEHADGVGHLRAVPRRPGGGRAMRILLGALAAIQFVIGLWALFLPVAFYEASRTAARPGSPCSRRTTSTSCATSAPAPWPSASPWRSRRGGSTGGW